jgi:hypothetical protein
MQLDGFFASLGGSFVKYVDIKMQIYSRATLAIYQIEELPRIDVQLFFNNLLN